MRLGPTYCSKTIRHAGSEFRCEWRRYLQSLVEELAAIRNAEMRTLERKHPEREARDGTQNAPRVLSWLVKACLAAALIASPLFAHGCHGNEDNELLATLTNWIISKRKYKLEPMAEVVMDVFLNGVSAS